MVQIMAWRRPGDKPLSEPMMVSLLTHICVARPQWVKGTITQNLDVFFVASPKKADEHKEISGYLKRMNAWCDFTHWNRNVVIFQFRHWLHKNLPFWILSMQLATKMLSKWQHLPYSAVMLLMVPSPGWDLHHALWRCQLHICSGAVPHPGSSVWRISIPPSLVQAHWQQLWPALCSTISSWKLLTPGQKFIDIFR